MKDAMQELEFDDPSSEPLKAVLLQCFVTPVILKADQVLIYIFVLLNILNDISGEKVFEFIVLLVFTIHC